jgi:uncharacterized membrane protein YqiK
MSIAENTRGIGDNLAPIADLLAEETVELRLRAEVLAEQVGKAECDTEEQAQGCTVLVGMIKEHLGIIEKQRVKRKEPYLQTTREIDAHYGGLAQILVIEDGKRKQVGGPLFKLVTLLDEYRREQERKAAAERRRLEEEARLRREAQEAAERAAREAEARRQREAEEAERKIREAQAAAEKAKSDAEIEKARRAAAEAQLEQEQAAARAKTEREAEERRIAEEQAAAEKLDREAEAATFGAGTVRTAYGVSAHTRKVWKVGQITDIRKALAHLLMINKGAVEAFVLQQYGAQVRAGVRALPGATVVEDSATTVRTR